MTTTMTNPTTSTPAADSLTSDALGTLNDLLTGSRDGATNYRKAAEDLRRRDIADALLAFAAERDDAVAELETEVRRLGHEPAEGGRLSAKARRAVQEAKSVVSGNDDSATLSEIEHGLDQTEGNYQWALRQAMPAATRALLERQDAAVQQQHDQVTAFLRQDPGGRTAQA